EQDEEDESKAITDANIQMQNLFTDPGKLDNYLDTEAIDWKSDEQADYNEKSDTKKIDLSYYDDDINKCVENQVKMGLSQENARTFCQNLANYTGNSDITKDDQDLPVNYQNREYVTGSDTGSHTAAYDEDYFKSLEAYFTRDKESLVDPLEGGDFDVPHGSNPQTDHRKNKIESNPHSHNFGMDGPTYDHFGNKVVDEANTSEPDSYTHEHNSNIDDNDHITTHMDPTQKQMGQQNIEQIPAENDNESMQGLGQD